MSLSPTVPDTCPSGDALSALITGSAPTGVSPTVTDSGVSPTVGWTHRDRRSREHLRPDEVECLLAAAKKNRQGHRDYTLLTDLWKEFEVSPELLRQWGGRMREEGGYTSRVPKGYYLTDTGGRRLGVWYSEFPQTTIEIRGEREIVVHTPDKIRDIRSDSPSGFRTGN